VLFWPEVPFVALVIAFGSYTLIEGSIRTAVGLKNRPLRRWRWEMLLNGFIGFCIGLSAVMWPDALVLLFLYLMVGWATAMGALKVAEAIRIGHEVEGRALHIVEGVLSFAFGALVASLPVSGELAITWIIGMYALLFGIMLLALAVRLYFKKAESHSKTI